MILKNNPLVIGAIGIISVAFLGRLAVLPWFKDAGSDPPPVLVCLALNGLRNLALADTSLAQTPLQLFSLEPSTYQHPEVIHSTSTAYREFCEAVIQARDRKIESLPSGRQGRFHQEVLDVVYVVADMLVDEGSGQWFLVNMQSGLDANQGIRDYFARFSFGIIKSAAVKREIFIKRACQAIWEATYLANKRGVGYYSHRS
ncbi:uncharacterized protein PpBr36_11075 [Pyricularia pennisetigena]|uniref:uncharacterized protein n=1 Tax=Pyricularia pennisetigena TaxID=1578925 RepID=UPI001151A0CC|nr:uncharacterized protein PpBr36_11075 [Pyricularia pennisetigena]TLS20621.1 hypothetical protein PpBr36_11075 [Pyricularia pennisetigena]